MTTNTELVEFKAAVLAEAENAKRTFGYSHEIDAIIERLALRPDPLDTEPARGSIVRRGRSSVVFVRPWGSYSDGGQHWRSSDNNLQTFTWAELRAHTEGVVVLVDTKGAQSYDEVPA